MKLHSLKSYFAIDPSSCAQMSLPPVASNLPVASCKPQVVTSSPPTVSYHPQVVRSSPPETNCKPPIATSSPPVASYYAPVATSPSPVASCNQTGVIYHPEYVLQQRPPESMTYVLQKGPPETLNCAPNIARKRNLKKY